MTFEIASKGKNIREKSSVELFIHPRSVSNEYYHLVFALDGEKYEARCPGNILHKIGAEYKYTPGKGSFTMEIKVPAWKLGDFRNGAAWKGSFDVNSIVYTSSLIKSHWTLGGNLPHNVTGFLPLQIGTPVTINGIFNKVEKNRRKYPAILKVLEKVPVGWYASLPQKGGAVYGIQKDPSPHEETLYITKVFANYPIRNDFKEGDKLLITFEAKGKGKLSTGFIRYLKKNSRFIKTEYPAKAFILTDKWQKFSFEYVMKKDETITLAFNSFRCEAKIDNTNIVIQEK